ncbi:MAG: AAA family ATPase [Candidatus Sumerlaeia bacterium]|nr:AAA family ATPase [Candidatus Sumerlaeia bacterium]
MEPEKLIARLRENIVSVMRGKREVVDLCICALLARGHVLLEDVPGVGKTTLASLLARSIDGSFQRIQFTSDLLPSDILGVSIFDPERRAFEFREGPLFANVVLADEINRTTPKTQSALLEAMNTGQVSMDRETHRLPHPFMVVATQNPIEFHGTFPLPKSQMDRFLVRISVGYPSREAEMQILREQRMAQEETNVKPALSIAEVELLQQVAMDVKVDDDLLDYITRIAEATRSAAVFELGLSTRGTLALRRAAQARALLDARRFVTPDDIKAVAVAVVAHRVQVAQSFERGGVASQEEVEAVREVLQRVDVPV